MKKIVVSLLLSLMLVCSLFGAGKSKVQAYNFDFSKDFYPGVGYVILNGNCFKDAVFSKADIMKNEYIIEKVTCYAALVPISLTLKVTLEKDGSLSYEYSDLKYKKDGSKTELTPLVMVSAITDNFNKLLPEVFSDEAKYNATKAKFFENAGMLFAISDGLTEIRAAKFAEMVKDVDMNIKAKVFEAKMNDNPDYPDYKYYVSTTVNVSMLSFISIRFYTNDDDIASLAKDDDVIVKGKIKEFIVNNISKHTMFVVAE